MREAERERKEGGKGRGRGRGRKGERGEGEEGRGRKGRGRGRERKGERGDAAVSRFSNGPRSCSSALAGNAGALFSATASAKARRAVRGALVSAMMRNVVAPTQAYAPSNDPLRPGRGGCRRAPSTGAMAVAGRHGPATTRASSRSCSG